MRNWLTHYLGALDWLGQARVWGINALLTRLAADELSAATYNVTRAALRGAFSQAFLLDQVGYDAF